MTRAVVFLTATLLLASFGAVAQNKSSPSGGQNASVEASASSQNATQPAVQGARPVHTQGTTAPASNDIQKTAQGEDPAPVTAAQNCHKLLRSFRFWDYLDLVRWLLACSRADDFLCRSEGPALFRGR